MTHMLCLMQQHLCARDTFQDICFIFIYIFLLVIMQLMHADALLYLVFVGGINAFGGQFCNSTYFSCN